MQRILFEYLFTRTAVTFWPSNKVDATHLEIPEPDFIIENGEGQDVVDEGLGTTSRRWHSEYLRDANLVFSSNEISQTMYMREHLLRQLSPLRIIESFVKAQQSAASFQTIPRKLQFVHRVDILDMQLDARSIGGLCSPHVEVFVTSGFKV